MRTFVGRPLELSTYIVKSEEKYLNYYITVLNTVKQDEFFLLLLAFTRIFMYLSGKHKIISLICPLIVSCVNTVVLIY